MAYVYRHIRLDKNIPFYIGVGERKGYDRAYAKNNRTKYWKNIVEKSDYEVEILFDGIERDVALEKEKEFILLYGRVDLGTGTLVNMTEGGDAGYSMIGRKQSAEHIKKTSIRHKGKIVSLETKEKIRLSRLGIKQTPETIERRASKLRGQKRFFTEEHKLKISNTLKGRKLTEETKEKLKAARVGRKPTLGRINTKEQNEKISIGNCKYLYIIQIPNGEVITVENLNQFSKKNKLNSNFLYTIDGHDTLGNTVKTCKGFKILYKIKVK